MHNVFSPRKRGAILLWFTFRAGAQLAEMSSGRYTHWNTEMILTNVVKPGGTVSVVDHPEPKLFCEKSVLSCLWTTTERADAGANRLVVSATADAERCCRLIASHEEIVGEKTRKTR